MPLHLKLRCWGGVLPNAGSVLWGVFFAWLCLIHALPGMASELDRQVALRATITVTNKGDIPLNPYIHRLTMPAEDHAQQQLLGIEYPYGDAYTIKQHDNGVDKYMEFTWQVPPRSKLVREVVFPLRIRAYDYRDEPVSVGFPNNLFQPFSSFLSPSLYVESDADEIKRIADGIKSTTTDKKAQLQAAYLYPQRVLKYRNMDNQGALYALRYGEGDCTEYAAVFVAISRALGVPARLTSDFLFTKRLDFSVPNHHAAEVFVGKRWIPVDPNLALEPALGYGFGNGAASKVVLKRGDSWTWASRVPGVAKQYRDNEMTVQMRWDIRVQ